MAQRQSFQIGTGLFIVLGFLALGYLATQTTSLANYRQGDSYMLKVEYTNIGQLKLRAPVKLAGVRVGTVSAIELEPDKLQALVKLSIDKRFDKIPDDSTAAIFTSGLLGDQYVAIQPGGSMEMFKDGDQFLLLQNSMQLEELIGKYLLGGDSAKKSDAAPDQPATKPNAAAPDKPATKADVSAPDQPAQKK
jgi:phospholipid/cholesterol/gamma-HCH transport system substrate-binding protein